MELVRLKADEYGTLKDIHDGFTPDPRSSIAIVARDGTSIYGRVFIVCPAHVEGPWVREDKRGSLLGKILMVRAEKEAKKCGISKMFAYATSPYLESCLQVLGYKIEPYTVWSKEI